MEFVTGLGRLSYEPYQASFEFPLEVGKAWNQRTNAKRETRSWVYEDSVQVQGWEQVKVPAGTFDTLKVVVKGTYNGQSSQFSWRGTRNLIFWYSPVVRRPVKWTYEDGGSRTFSRDIRELVSYKLE